MGYGKLILHGKMKTCVAKYHCPDVSSHKLKILRKNLWLELSAHPLVSTDTTLSLREKLSQYNPLWKTLS